MLDILRKIWNASSGYVFMPKRRDGMWVEGPPINLASPTWPVFDEGADLYFTPLVFWDPERTNEAVGGMRCLFADIDTGLLDRIRPSICWETSPGSYQGVWLLDQTVVPEVFASLNRDLTYYIGADRGGWHASKVLRIPGTLNWKRAKYNEDGLTVPRGRVLWDDDVFYNPGSLRLDIPHTTRAVRLADVGPEPSPLGERDRQSILTTYRDWLPMRVRSWLTDRHVTDRSMMIWKVACTLAMSEVPPADAFQMIYGTPWNKWKDDPAKLWRDINKAYQHVQAVVKSPSVEPSGGAE